MKRALLSLVVSLGFAWTNASGEEAKRVTITIRVVDGSCKPVPGAWVALTPVARKATAQTMSVDAEGVVSFVSQAVAAYRIEARAESRASSAIDPLYIDHDYSAVISLNRLPGVRTVIVE